MNRLLIALSLVMALPFMAASRDTFENLPGVKDPAAQRDVQMDVDCTSQLQRAWPSRFPERNGLAERTYSCDDGGNLSVGSNRPPNLIEYRKFKEYYNAN